MSNSLPENLFSNHLENLVQSFVKEKLELIMEEERENFFKVENPELDSSKNGYYQRNLDTKYGRINLSVPRDREGYYTTHVFGPYERREKWLGETIINMYQHGFSTREVGQFIERILGDQYSAATISNITDVVVDDIESWKKRSLSRRYSVLYLDGTYFKLRRQDVDNEVIYMIIGMNEDGQKEILDFRVGGKESANVWKEQLYKLRDRGVEEVLLGVFDGLTGLDAALKEVFPKADVQRCVVHKLRNTQSMVRVKDKEHLFEDLKPVYRAEDKEQALENFEKFKQNWKKIYPKVIQSWEEDLSDLLRFYDYPPIIRPQIYTTNTIERAIKEIKKRLKPMNSLPSEKAVEKIIYLVSIDYNETWKNRKNTTFRSAYTELQKMFKERYQLNE
ncbi:IS256 family transposase [Virgibacillus sp. SK37]|uniref:IS256 family transposase n=1 Tax=Virgibacillus sp. SK37 TaxID=403957 RepID=UPI0004D17526|nr:IS256 family transposase [Virgibacillus sp. SK37]AIF42483.1 transposase [Virgibacillus sp. SK37]AIF42814.1 transposase [Virgibacillus sp. SK37]AIF43049.1 transposase [Virgibacillus sp. SK37]